MPTFEAKVAFALQVHRAMERATQLRSRVRGLCYAVASQATVAAGWRAALQQVDSAQTPAGLLVAVYRWLHPRLTDLYRNHLMDTDPDGDRASIELIRSFEASIERDRRDGLTLLSTSRRADKAWLRELDHLWGERMSGEPLTLDHALWQPLDRVPAAVRPDGVRVPQPGSLGVLLVDPLHDPQDIGKFLHKELDEEYTTLELLARNSYEHPDMPWAFHRDMARQISDEARHAIIITRLMAARGFRHGDFPVSTSSYDGIYEFEPCPPGSRDELLWRILIRQTFDEGLAIDNLAYEIDRRCRAGQTDIATAFEYILRDEVFHAQSGLRWSRELIGARAISLAKVREEAIAYFTRRAELIRENYVLENLDEAMGELATVQEGKGHQRGKMPERPLNQLGRAQAGFDDDDIRQIIALGYANEPVQSQGDH